MDEQHTRGTIISFFTGNRIYLLVFNTFYYVFDVCKFQLLNLRV